MTPTTTQNKLERTGKVDLANSISTGDTIQKNAPIILLSDLGSLYDRVFCQVAGAGRVSKLNHYTSTNSNGVATTYNSVSLRLDGSKLKIPIKDENIVTKLQEQLSTGQIKEEKTIIVFVIQVENEHISQENSYNKGEHKVDSTFGKPKDLLDYYILKD